VLIFKFKTFFFCPEKVNGCLRKVTTTTALKNAGIHHLEVGVTGGVTLSPLPEKILVWGRAQETINSLWTAWA